MINWVKLTRKNKPNSTLIRLFIRSLIFMKMKFYKKMLSDNIPIGDGEVILLPTQFVGNGVIKLNNCQLGVWPSPHFLDGNGYIEARSADAKVIVGDGTVINNNFSIIADRTSVEIGERCFIGANFFATDSDFHGIEISSRVGENYKFGKVCIENDVFIGEGVKVLNSVTIGSGAVIACGSVVVDSVERNSVYGGVPARLIRKIKV